MVNAGTHKQKAAYKDVIKKLTSYFTLLLLLMLGACPAFAQTDYSGTYYIAMTGTGSYDASTPANNYYLCPTENWCYYVATDNVQSTDNGQPFLTTYKCKDGSNDSKGKWIIQKHETEAYYYIIHWDDNKYLTYNGQISGAGENRARVHLESSITGNANLFAITFNNGYYFISSKNDPKQYLNVTDGNKDSYQGATGKTDGPTGYKNVGGIIGRWSDKNNTSQFIFEEPVIRPVIAYNQSNQIEITDPTGNATIYYTTDGTLPTTSSNQYSGPFVRADGVTTIKAISVIGDDASKIATFATPVAFGNTHKYLIQSQNNAWNETDYHFYMIPGDEENSVTKVNTTSLFRPSMEWYFMNAGAEDGVQYYYIVNNDNSKNLCYDTTNGVYMDVNGNNSSKFKFSIVESPTTGTYNITPYGLTTGDRFVNKATHNANNGVINLASSNSTANARWKFVAPSQLDTDAPFTVSDPGTGNYNYYKIANVGNTDHYIISGTENAVTSNSSDPAVINTMNWYFEEAQTADASDWLTYYHIRNAVTGHYLYFTKDINNDGPCLEMRSTIESGNEDRYMFTWAKTADANVDYYIIPKKLKDVSQNQLSALRKNDSNTSISTNVTREAGRFAWKFESSAYTCAQPVIIYDPAQGGYTITATEKDAKIYYMTGDGVLTPSTGTLYTGAISVAEMNASSVTIRAIAARNSDGSDASAVSSVTVNRVATPTYSLSDDGKVQLDCTTDGVSYYYEIGNPAQVSDPTTGSTPYNGPIENAAGKVIKAIAVKDGWINSAVMTSGTITFTCATPVIRKASATTFTINCSFPATGVTIRYTKGDGTQAAPTESTGTVYDGDVTFSNSELPFTIKAIAVATDYNNSTIVTKTFKMSIVPGDDGYYEIADADDFEKFIDMVNSDDPDKKYKITADITVSNTSAIEVPFTGELTGVPDASGNLPVINGLNHAIFDCIDGGTVKNIILDNVTISGSGNTGAIANQAIGDSRIYNCGVLATSSNSTISGSGYVGGIVGLLDDGSRVINCFSYADVSGGSHVGGIVGYNNVATTAANLKTMVMNCMFYGELSGSSIAPIYNGQIITNVGDGVGVSNFNFFRLESSYIQDNSIEKVYNCALGAETRFLQRFEFYRHLLNSNRELAAWWATGSAANKNEMMKWVLEPSQIGSATPYPILKTAGKYASVVNYTPDETAFDADHRNEGRKLTNIGTDGKLAVTIQAASDGASGATITTSSLNLTITDKDFEHFNFNYGKVQLPYYNDVGSNNYTDGKVVTGWKIVGITGGTAGNYSTGADDVTYTDGELTATPYNFADRKCTDKDLFSESGRVFNQGAYWDVPEGVTAITIEPYWGKAVYLGDAYYDVVYNTSMNTAYNVTTVGGGQRYNNGVSTFNNQKVYTSLSSAVSALSPSSTSTVYDYAVVLVGNYHQYNGIGNGNTPYTITSVDRDGDNEPDYSFILRFDGRTAFHPVRYDFLNLIGLGMAQKSTGGTGSYNLGIMQPKYWFEVTNTALFRVTQFEYSRADRVKNPYILQGGVIEQWVTQQNDAGDRVSYFHIGGNVWFKEFHRGSHQDNAGKSTPHPPVSVTGGDFDKFYLTGLYQSQAKIYDDNAECYINGGRFGEIAGAGMEGIGTSNGKGNITWVIDNADIREFYGGGINFAKPVHGNIHTIISNSYVDVFCGGPKFGDMVSGRTVTTTATNCTFGTYFGAGYGGNSYNRYAPKNRNNLINLPGKGKVNNNEADFNSWNDWVAAEYTQSYSSNYGGISTQFDYQFIPMSSNIENVARLFVDFVNFSLATCRDVTSNLTGCKITGNFYGGGSLGKVDGPVTSTLTNCTVDGSVFGAGYSASLPTVDVMDAGGFNPEPHYYTDLGTYRTGVFPATTTYTWQQGNAISIDKTNHILYTTEDLTSLGTVTGKVTLNINQGTTVAHNVYGGGESSDATGDVDVNINDGTISQDVYGGGMGKTTVVGGDVNVYIGSKSDATPPVYSGNPAIAGDVYGGSAFGAVNATKGTGWTLTDLKLSASDGKVTDVYLYAGSVAGSIYGGGLGQNLQGTENDIAANVFGPVTVTTEGGSARNVFGCNNILGAPLQDVTVNILGGTISGNVYGGGNQAAYTNTTSNYPLVKIIDGTIAGDVFGGGLGTTATVTANPIVTLTDGTVQGNAYGGGDAAPVIGNTHIMSKGTNVGESLFGGGNKADVSGSVTVDIENGTIAGDVYGGGALANTNIANWDATKNNNNGGWADDMTSATNTTTVNLTGGTINGNVYGGGLGDEDGVEAMVYGNILVTLNGTYLKAGYDSLGLPDSGIVFGCNNVNGTPKGHVLVQILKTVGSDGRVTTGRSTEENLEKEIDEGIHLYQLSAVYGGGNKASYKPLDNNEFAQVLINGCEQVSISAVYGGGNAASTPATEITINGAYEIGYVFGGGNGAGANNPGANVGYLPFPEDYAHTSNSDEDIAARKASIYVYGTGVTTTNIYGGRIHQIFGGSNTKGNVRDKTILSIDEISECPLFLDGTYGGGRSAYMEGNANIILGCTSGFKEIYGGSENADVGSDVSLTITSGHFESVFGGNNLGGRIFGSITLNIEQTGCLPIKIDNLYLGGNNAPYSVYGYNGNDIIERGNSKLFRDPQLNIRSCDSIGNVYGGGKGVTATMAGDPSIHVNITQGWISGEYQGQGYTQYKGKPQLVDDGEINTIYGGGDQAKVIGNTKIFIADSAQVQLESLKGLKQKINAIQPPNEPKLKMGSITIELDNNDNNIKYSGTGTEADSIISQPIVQPVKGATINGNVYGGGNQADVTGSTYIQIGPE